MALSQHPIDHAQKRARSTNDLGGLGVRQLSACSSLHQAPLSFFHAVSRVPPRNLLKKRILWITAEPGVGKSALAAWLGEQLPETSAFHYFAWDDNNRRDPEAALESVAYQLTTCIPG